jgi:hypothetical protein
MLEYGPGVLFQAGFRGKRHSHFMLLSLAMAFWSQVMLYFSTLPSQLFNWTRVLQPTATASTLAYAEVCYHLWLRNIHANHPQRKEYTVIPVSLQASWHLER